MYKKVSVTVSVCLVLALGGMLYYGRYQDAVWRAEEGLYGKARSALELPFITEIHDPGFVDYVEGGELLEYGEYDRAREILQPLAEQNYRNAASLLLEVDYNEAHYFMYQQQYDKAAELLTPLAEQNYSDSLAMLEECLWKIKPA